MLARIPAVGLALAAITASCAHRPAMCSRTCDEGFACVAGECLRNAQVADVEALDKFGLYQARRVVVPPIEVVRLAPGDANGGEVPRVVTLGRTRDAGAVLLLRFALDLPPGAALLAAEVVLDRAPAIDVDPAPVLLHAARITEPWGGRSIAWGRAPRLDHVGSAVTTIDDARPSIRIDVRPLVQRWRRHSPDDQGIALVADRSSATGISFALADGGGSSDARAPVLSVRSTKESSPTFHTSSAEEESVEPASLRGPRLELYLRP